MDYKDLFPAHLSLGGTKYTVTCRSRQWCMDGRAPITADVLTNTGANLTANFINCWQPDGTTLTFADDGAGATVVNKVPTWA